MSFDALAEPSSLVVFLMLDTSGSMAFETAEGETKARAVRDALADFFADPASAGIGVGAAFFPIRKPEVPLQCVSDDACGEPGACWRKAFKRCLPGPEKACETDADCQDGSDPDNACYEIGLCADDAEKDCVVGFASTFCNPDVECVTWGGCLNDVSCESAEYATPVVAVGILPDARSKLVLAIDTRVQEGSTPTLPALDGALSTARAWQDAHSRDKAILLLATDGLPTSCDPAIETYGEETTEGVPSVVASAKDGFADGVQTFVVGVFAPDEEQIATFALGQIAEGGGTTSAFIVTTDDVVSERLVETFNEIRARADVCEYTIPWPSQGGVDPRSLVVTLDSSTPSGTSENVPRVASPELCDPLAGGFYFDREPQPGVLPHRIVLCPASCGAGGSRRPDLIHLKGQCDAVYQ